MRAILSFLGEARTELLRVNWPSKQEIIRYTTLVIAISLAAALFLGALDYIFSALIEKFLLT